ncbi:protein NLRC5 isoform X3 [Ursus maritimus]|uniref:Protein NLRC5 n=1 Tax=Ursus maritimus TaxID=29073 RepID=A0A8M1GB57_URSMA|nr:protein NLRC5 isoform X3 [Ursus maritimus]
MDPVSLQLGTSHLWSWLVRLLSKDPEWLNAKVKFFLPKMDLSSEDKAQDAAQGVILQLGRLHTQGRATWQAFIHCVCMELDVPLDLEVPLLSTWGHGDGFPSQLETGEESQPVSQLHHGLKRPYQSCGSSPRLKQCKKQQLELARKYLQLLKTSAQQRYAGGSPGPGQPLAFHQAYIPPILQWSRTTAPIHTQEGATLAEDGTDVSIRDLFNTRADKGPRVTVLLGKAGMGKTTLAHRLCQRWADGQLDRFQALFLFEFRQLNLVTCLLTLPQLLFDLYVSPEAGSDSVFRYLEDNADGVLLIFDGLDQALHPHCSREKEGPEDPSPALALFSGLCRGTLLPGCWVLATSRPGKLPDCLPVEAATVHMWGFDRPRMEEYVGRVFSDPLRQEAALAELRESRHLRSMCAVPALCWVTCLCLHRLLPGSSPGQAAALLPTVTQNYVQMVATLGPRGCLPPKSLLDLSEVALRGLETGKVLFSVGDIHPSTMASGAALGLLTSFCICTGPGHQDTGYAFTHLSLQEFFAALYLMASPKVDKTALVGHVTLNSHWVLRTKARPGLLDHLPTFLAGLASCACRPFLSLVAQRDETWVSAKQAAVMQALRKLAARRLTGPKVVALCHCVGETQEPELASLVAQSLPYHLSFHNFPLTYTDLAALTNILGHRNAPIHLDFEGCPLEPHCPEALAGCKQVENLSFKSRKCGDAFAEALSRSLPTMGNLKKLGLSGSKITARGIGHLVPALRLCPQLEEVSFQDNQLKDWAVLNIVEVLPCLPRLQKLDLSRNNVSMSTLLCLTKVAVACPTVRTLQVREADLIFLLSPPAETAAELQGAPDLLGNAGQRRRRAELQDRSLTLRLQQCHLRVHDVQELIAQLQEGPHLDVVDLSGNQLDDEGCRLMAEATSQLRIARKLDLSDNGLSVDGVHCVLSAASTCQTLEELHISLLHKTVVFTFAPEPEQQKGIRRRAALWVSLTHLMPSEPLLHATRIRLTHCGLQAKHLEPLCRALRGSCRLGHLDFSGNALGDEGVAQLARLLPGLGALQSLDLSENGLSLDAVLMLAPCFATLQWLLHLDISSESQHVILRGDRRGRDLAGGSLPQFPAGAQFFAFGQRRVPRTFCLSQCQLEPLSLTRLCETLEKCPGPLEVKLSCEVLSDKSLETLLHHLPRLPQLRLLQLSQTKLSPKSPLLLADLFSLCPRVQKVDLRSLYHVTLHFKSSEEREGECCGRFTDCGLSQEHVEPLCWLLSKCEELNQLDLSANMLGDDGLQCLLECLPQLPISGSLDLSHNSISLESALGLVKTLPSCPRVREASVNLGSEQSFWMHFSRQEEAGKTLRLSQCSFGPEHVPRLAAGLNQSLKLTALTLTQCCLGLEQLTLLLSLLRWPVGLFSLSISETQQQLCLQLEFPRQENPEAVALRLAHCDLGTHHNLLVWRLMETCARLRQLSLSQVNLCDTSSLLLQSLLQSLSELKTFRLTSSCVSSKGLAHVMSGLSHCYHLEELDLSNNRFGEEDTRVLMGVLEGMCRLKRLNLSHLPLGSAALAELTQGLSHMTLLQSLRLSHNQIRDIGAQHLAAVLSELPELRKIDLSGNGIGPAGGVQLAESLALCKHLEELMLGYNVLGNDTVLRLAQRLPHHLRVLHLPSSGLSLEGLLILSQALDGCPYVEEISLVSCEIDNHAAKPLAASLVLCPALEEILLSWNLLGDEAAAELAQVLPQMGRLKRMDLEKNRITACGAWLLVEGLAQGSGIQVIRLWNNPISPDVAQHLQSQEPRLDFAFFDKQPQPPRGS